jgi:hypothetical protein
MKNGLKIDKYKTKRYYKDDLLHRENGPAVEYSTGTKYYYKDNLLHREDGPALEYSRGHKEWYIYGKLHREDGPAIEYPDGYKAWYLDDKQIFCKDNEEFLKRVKWKLFW